MVMTCSMLVDRFLTVTPSDCTSAGRAATTWLTRLDTFTVFISGSEPTSKLTARL